DSDHSDHYLYWCCDLLPLLDCPQHRSIRKEEMKFLVLVFLLMALYGTVTGKLGAALLALGMAGLVQYARGHFARADAKWEALPQHAKQPVDTHDALCRYDCECTRDRI